MTCLSLPHLLDENKIKHVGYMTVDLEGGEPAFLRHFDFKKYRVDVMQVECNVQSTRMVTTGGDPPMMQGGSQSIPINATTLRMLGYNKYSRSIISMLEQ